MVKENLKYTKEHEWIKDEDDVITVGISDYAQKELGDIVFVELPEPGAKLTKGDSPVTLESVKAVSSVYAPFSGKVTVVNAILEDEPELINLSPFDEGWIFKMKAEEMNNSELMNAEEYQKFIDTLD